MAMEIRTEILSTNTPALFASAVTRAARLLRAGEVVALPTETVYGLAANALEAKAVARIFQIKGRPANNPIIVHVASLEMARHCCREWPEAAEKLARGILARPTDAGVAAGADDSRRRYRRRRHRGCTLAGSSVHPGGHSRVRFPAGCAQRQRFQPPVTDQRRTRPRPAWREDPLIVDGRPIAGGH